MTRVEIDRRIKKAGWKIVHGKAHDLAVSQSGKKVPLPRHRGDIPIGTMMNIFKMSICCN